MTDSLSSEQKSKTNTSPIRVLRNRTFHLLWIREGISLLGDQFYLIALPWPVLSLTGDALAVGTVLATAVWFMRKTNLPARKIMETHTAVDELQVIYRDVLKTGKELGIPMLHYLSLKNYVDNPPTLHKQA